MRVVSLLPSATELLCAVGGRSLLVGRSHECDFPDALDHIPVLTSARTEPTGVPHESAHSAPDPGQIDRQVRDLLAQGTALYHLDTDRLASLKPDLILTQDLCAVCSIDLASVERVVADLRTRGLASPRVLSLNPSTIEDVLDDLLRVASAIDRPKSGLDAVLALQERLQTAQAHVNPFDDGPVVGFLEWTDPLFVAGHWTVQLIERAGGRHPLNPTVAPEGFGTAAGLQQGARRAGKSIRVEPADFASSRPEWLVIAPCGLSLDATRHAADALARETWFQDLPSVRAGRVAIVDGNQMFNRPGPRLADAFEWLVSWLQDRPELAPQGFPAEAWNR